MLIEASIRDPNQITIEAALPNSTLIPGYQQDCLAIGIKGKGYAPCASVSIKALLLHVGVP